MLQIRFGSLVALLFIISCVHQVEVADDLIDFEVFETGELQVNMDPNGITPLSGLLEFTTSIPAEVSITIYGQEEISYTHYGHRTDHSVPVVGLYAGMLNLVNVTLEDLDGNRAQHTLDVLTPALPDFFPDITIDVNTGMKEEGLVFCEFSRGRGYSFTSTPFAVDEYGAVRWWFDFSMFSGIIFPVRYTERNTLLIGFRDALKEFDYTGRLLRTIHLPGYRQHHEVLRKPNGNYLVAVDKLSESTVEDHIIEVNQNGTVVNEWDLRQLLDVDRFDLVDNPYDWFHMNAIFHDPSDNSLIVSGRNQGVVKITENNELVWILAPHKGWGRAGVFGNGPETRDYLLTAVKDDGLPYNQSVQDGINQFVDFEWVWGQHAPMLLPNGNIFIYDNGFNRNFEFAGNYSRGVEYEIDETNRTVRQVWEYGKDRGPELNSPIISDVDVLENGNRLISSGIIFGPDPKTKIVEVLYPQKTVAFEMTLHHKNSQSSGSFNWGDFDLMYRAEKRDFY
jgi:arylsulfate sulfotransferase